MRCNADVDKPTKRRERRLLKLSHFPSHGAISPEASPLSGRGKVAPRGRAGRGAPEENGGPFRFSLRISARRWARLVATAAENSLRWDLEAVATWLSANAPGDITSATHQSLRL